MKRKFTFLMLLIAIFTFVLTGCDFKGLFRGSGDTPHTSVPIEPSEQIFNTIDLNVIDKDKLNLIENAESADNLEQYTNLVLVIERLKKSVVEVQSGENLFMGVVVGKSKGQGENENGENSLNSSANVSAKTLEKSYILTTLSKIQNNNYLIKTFDGEQLNATFIGGDVESDICVLAVEKSLNVVEFYPNESKLSAGDSLVTIANPLGVEGGSSLTGIVSGENLNAEIEGFKYNFVQTDIQVNSSFSGGGLFTSTGLFYGMFSEEYKAQISQDSPLNFAISSTDVLSIVSQLVENSSNQGYGYIKGKYKLGVSLVDEYANRWGTLINVVVDEIDEQGCLYDGGLRRGDVIKSIEYKGEIFAPNKSQELTEYFKANTFEIGDTITLSITRNETSRTVAVRIKQFVYNP